VSTGFENKIFAEESTGYLMAEDVSAHITFNFRDGTETHEFPVFHTTSDLVANQGTSFQVQRVVGEAPHLHKALDEAFKYREATGAKYNYQLFDIDVDFTFADGSYDTHHALYQRSGGDDDLIPEDAKPRKTIHYVDCEVEDYLVETMYNFYRSYNPEAETGFAIVETIAFQCGGIQSEITSQKIPKRTDTGIVNEFPKLDYTYADDIRTVVTFEFDYGVETIEFPIFHLVSGFAEDDDPSFHVEGVVNRYPLLASAIDNARDSGNISGGSNIDFNAKVEFLKKTIWGGEKLLRGIDYEDCIVKGSNITTYWDNEETYLLVGGMAVMQTIDFDCAGMEPQNPGYNSTQINNRHNRNYNMGTGPSVTAEFRFHDNTIANIDFPAFVQQEILSKSNPTFQLKGIVGDYPLLYKQVDDDAKINQITGVTQSNKLFDVDVNLKYNDQTARTFTYSDCRVIDYKVTTQQQNEEGFWVGMALENTFEFECLEYQPEIPSYDMIFETDISDKTTTWAGITFDGYMYAENVTSNLTFIFRDAVETQEFPVFRTTSDFAENKGTSFQVERVVGDTPYLHKAFDEAFKYRTTSNSFDYNYKYFDVIADVPDDDEIRKTFRYNNCRVDDYFVNTYYHTNRGYVLPTQNGFAVVETIDFQCNGVHSKVTEQSDLSYRTEPGVVNDFGKLDYTYANGVHTYVTFEFDNGIEKIEFPVFKITSGFAEDDDPSFHVEGVVNRYPLLASAIDNARDERGLTIGVNTDFNAKVEFIEETTEGEKLLRGIDYEDCTVKGSDIDTYYDHEEPYVLLGGFTMNHSVDFDCSGMTPQNPGYDATITTNEQSRNYKRASEIYATTEFKFHDNTIAIITFPVFKQQEILSKSNPTFQLKGIVGEYPLLYKQVDDDVKINQMTGVSQTNKLFDVDVNIKHDDQTVRGFTYSDCRVIDYKVGTALNSGGVEESWEFWFALQDTYEFECLGYQPNNPIYDEMFESIKTKSISTLDLRATDTWGDEFKYKPKR
jgi:hypothetical protein